MHFQARVLYEVRRKFVFFNTMPYINIVLNIIPTLYEGCIVSVHRMVMENRPVDPGPSMSLYRCLTVTIVYLVQSIIAACVII